MENLDIKLFWSLLSIPLTIFLFIPYIIDIFKRKTQPHIYTWFIWSITMVIAIAWWYQWWWELLLITLWLPSLFVIFTFILSLKYGTKDITKFDIWILLLAIFSIFIFLALDNPLFAILLVSFIDALWYIPTFRKAFKNPYSETLIFWWGGIFLSILMILSLHEYNLLTLTYILTIWLSDLWLSLLIIYRRKTI
jgi:hypothetical protein